eukprot:876802-Rhodomonas_salina.2
MILRPSRGSFHCLVPYVTSLSCCCTRLRARASTSLNWSESMHNRIAHCVTEPSVRVDSDA